MSFSASQSAFAGFGVVRRNPLSFLVWTLLYLVFAGLAVGALFAVSGPTLMEIFRQGGARNTAGAVPPDFMLRLLPGLLVLYPILFVLGAILNAAIFRAVLRPEQKGFAYLSLGADELRLIAVSVVTGVVAFAFQFLVGMLKQALAGQGGAGVLISLVVSLLYWCLYIWAAVRVSLWAPQAFAERRIDFGRAWRLTGKRFWPLLGMLLLVLVVGLGVLIGVVLLGAVAGAIAVAASMGGHGAASTGVASPAFIGIMGVVVLFYILGIALMTILLSAAYASAYKGLAAPPDQAEVFA